LCCSHSRRVTSTGTRYQNRHASLNCHTSQHVATRSGTVQRGRWAKGAATCLARAQGQQANARKQSLSMGREFDTDRPLGDVLRNLSGRFRLDVRIALRVVIAVLVILALCIVTRMARVCKRAQCPGGKARQCGCRAWEKRWGGQAERKWRSGERGVVCFMVVVRAC
jgi:hypothetical protein